MYQPLLIFQLEFINRVIAKIHVNEFYPKMPNCLFIESLTTADNQDNITMKEKLEIIRRNTNVKGFCSISMMYSYLVSSEGLGLKQF